MTRAEYLAMVAKQIGDVDAFVFYGARAYEEMAFEKSPIRRTEAQWDDLDATEVLNQLLVQKAINEGRW